MSSLVDPFVRVAYRGAYNLALVWWFVRRPTTEGTLVGVWRGREVLLLQNSYRRDFSMPGGGQNPGESPAQTGSRELREEVGLHVPPERLRPVFMSQNRYVYKHDTCHFVELEVETEPPWCSTTARWCGPGSSTWTPRCACPSCESSASTWRTPCGGVRASRRRGRRTWTGGRRGSPRR
ncbi:NUDIX hydrolase [Cystobacter fuscus]